MTFGEIDSKVLLKSGFSTAFFGHFFVTLLSSSFESLSPGPRKSFSRHSFCVFEFFGVCGATSGRFPLGEGGALSQGPAAPAEEDLRSILSEFTSSHCRRRPGQCRCHEVGVAVGSLQARTSLIIGKPQVWERAHVGFGGKGREAQQPLHETMRLAEARLVRHAPGGSMPC